MAGRPKKMARAVTELEEQSLCLSADLFLIAPAHYRKDPNPGDPIGMAWNNCIASTMQAWAAIGRLADYWFEVAILPSEAGPDCRLPSRY